MFKESQKHLKYNSELDNHFICATHCSRKYPRQNLYTRQLAYLYDKIEMFLIEI